MVAKSHRRRWCRHGDLAFSLSPGLGITISEHQLITPEYDFDHNGRRYIRNDTDRLAQIYSLEDLSKDWMPNSGMGVFSAACLAVTNDLE